VDTDFGGGGGPDASIFMYRDFLQSHLKNARKGSGKYGRSSLHVLPSSSLRCFTLTGRSLTLTSCALDKF
jgi:hypothetical protein